MQKKKYFFIIVERFFECCTEGELKINTKVVLLFEKSKRKAKNGKNEQARIYLSTRACHISIKKEVLFIFYWLPPTCVH